MHSYALAGADRPILRRAHSCAEQRPHGAIAVHRGPLHYAYDIARSQKQLAQNAEQPLAVDLEFDATAPWQYAIDPDTLLTQRKRSVDLTKRGAGEHGRRELGYREENAAESWFRTALDKIFGGSSQKDE